MSLNSQAVSDNAKTRALVRPVDFANYPFIRRFAGHLNQQHSCAYLYNPGFQSPNQGQREHQAWEFRSIPAKRLPSRIWSSAGFRNGPGEGLLPTSWIRSVPASSSLPGRRGRAYAEANFPMPVIERRFMAMLAGVMP